MILLPNVKPKGMAHLIETEIVLPLEIDPILCGVKNLKMNNQKYNP